MRKKLTNGAEIPVVGFGTYKTPDDAEGRRVIREAIETGYRLIDTATLYTNERSVGQAVNELLDRDMVEGLRREDLFITTKLANADRGYDKTLRAFDRSMDSLGLGYLDLYLIHWPASEGTVDDWQKVNADTWRALEKLLADGRVRSIGVSNFMPVHLDALARTVQVMPMVNQIEFHPGCMQRSTLDWCHQHGIAVEGWSPLGRTRLFDNALLNEIARRYRRTIAQICLRWALQHGVIPLPKTMNRERMIQNLDIFDFELSPEDMRLIDSMPPTGESGLTPDNITF